MDAFDLLFGWGGQSLQLIFQFGFIPQKEDFLELTEEQYRQFKAKEGDYDEKIFMIAPVNPQNVVETDSDLLPIITESQRDAFFEAAKLIDKYCEGQKFHTDEEKLQFAAKHLPDVFSQGTKYEKYKRFTVSKSKIQ